MSTKCSLWHHSLGIDTFSQVCHELVVAMVADSTRDESNEVVSHVIYRMVDLGPGGDLDHLARAVETG